MSYTSIYSVKFSKSCEEIAELRNSHGSAPVVWDLLAQKYLGTQPFQYWSVTDRLWPLYQDKKLPAHHRAVLGLTFDRAYLDHKNFKRAAEDIRKFLSDFPPNPEYVNHWPKIADIIENAKEKNIGFQHTSVSENLFVEGSRVIKKKDCFEVYSELT